MRVPVQDRQKMAVQTAVLRFLYIGGVLTSALVAPKLVSLVGPFDRSLPRRKKLYTQISLARSRLKQRGLLCEKEVKGTRRFYLTPAGKRTIEKILFREYQIPEQVRWDGKWRMLIFDITEKRKGVRTQLRRLLAGAKFLRLQDSVWIYPYPCDEFVALVRAHLASGVGELRSFVVDALESDTSLRNHFGLSL